MKSFAKAVFWILVFCLLLLGSDQLLLRVPAQIPVYRELRVFYLDFRARLCKLAGPPQQRNEGGIEAVIEGAGDAVADKITTTAPEEQVKSGPRFLYVDKEGELHFADFLEEIPSDLRASAQALAP